MKNFLDYLREAEKRHPYLGENASAGATCAANVATAVNSTPKSGAIGLGFDPNGDWGIYDEAKPKKKSPKRGAPIIRR